MTPLACLKRRFEALQNHDYGTVFAGYHADSPFRQQFSTVDSYVAFAGEHLSRVMVRQWHCRKLRRLSPDRVECLLVIETRSGTSSGRLFELALLIRTAAGWRYHSAQKLDARDGVAAEAIDFSHFDQAQEKVRF